ncbi:hypothetical protein Dimus_002665 [Dionaea muscipula]
MDSNCRRNVKKVWVPKTQTTAATTSEVSQNQNIHGDKDSNMPMEKAPSCPIKDCDKICLPPSDPRILAQGERIDADNDIVAGCSDTDEPQFLEEAAGCSPRPLAIASNFLDTTYGNKSLDPDGFQLVWKKGRQKPRKPVKDHMEHHQDLPGSSKGRSSH